MKTKDEMLKMIDLMLDESADYHDRLDAYEYLLEDCQEVVDDMLTHLYSVEGETGKMLMEVLAEYKGNKGVYMGLVSYLYKGEDIALFARLLGAYGDDSAISILKIFAEENELNYNEFMEIRNAVEELGGDFDIKEDFSEDPFYRFLKGLDEPEEDSRRSPFEDYFNPPTAEKDLDDEDDCDCDCEDENCDHDHDHDDCDCEEEDCDCDCKDDDCDHDHDDCDCEEEDCDCDCKDDDCDHNHDHDDCDCDCDCDHD